MNSLLSAAMGLLLIALTCILATLGEAFAEMAIGCGPFTYLLSAVGGSLICAVMTYFLASLISYQFTGDECRKSTAYAISGILFLVSMTLPVVNFHGMKSRAIHLNENANTLQKTAVAFFNKVDNNHNGTITTQELEQALNTSTLSKKESGVAQDIKDRLSEVGHVIDKQTHIFPSGKTFMVSTTYTYGVNSEDLESYPARIKEKYKRW